MKIKLSGVLAVAALALGVASTASASELCAGVLDVTTITAAGGCTVTGSSLLFNNFADFATGGASGSSHSLTAASAMTRPKLQGQSPIPGTGFETPAPSNDPCAN